MSRHCPVFAGALQNLQEEELQDKAQELVKLVVSLVPKEHAKTLLFSTQDSTLIVLNEIVQLVIAKTFETFP